MDTIRAEHPRPNHFILHISDTHLLAGDEPLYGVVDSAARLRRIFDELEAAEARPEAIVFTGDLADRGEPGAYAKLRRIVEPAATRLGALVIWAMGNHDDRAHMRRALLGQQAGREAGDGEAPLDQVHDVNGLRIIALDTTVPGFHHGELTDAQLRWLAGQLAEPAPHGTILAMHHPPVPSVQELAVLVELRGQEQLAQVLRGSDVRAVIAGHLHYSTTATCAGIPVSVASATCYTQDLTGPAGGTRGRDGAQGYNMIHVYDETVVHSVVPLGGGTPVGRQVSQGESQRLLDAAGVVIPEATNPGRSAVTAR
ncbi:phosphodiesterase [Arthrobacter mobilis]|uniref:Phosphodiesterase n=1 Tax=Arthrobacter mobilis TaxID=2724944 RepID=A0A7X6H9X2_9MICC|nr:phosphodiesterase [Arthrobacter mobilis]NKX53146.1 phosphodiesterase [Arthrobacter mobilis]